jgi:hypothetical protein
MTNSVTYRKKQIIAKVEKTTEGTKTYTKEGVLALNGNKCLRLIGEKLPYMPLGGRKVLKSIIEECQEGKHYEWVDLTPFLFKAP